MMRDHNKSTTCRAYNYYESTKALFMYRTKVRRYYESTKVLSYFRTKVLSYIYCSPTCRATRKGLYEGTKVQHWYNVVVFSRTSALIA
jgi:hypothetical protein